MQLISVVDLGKIRDDGKNVVENQDWLQAAKQIRKGLGSIGFMYLINHGIPEQTISNAFVQSQKFFALPMDIKMKSKKDTSNAVDSDGKFDIRKYSGYMPVGGEVLQDDKYEIKETFDWVNKKYSMPTTDYTRDLHDSIIQLDTESKRLFRRLLKLLAMSLNLELDIFLKKCRHFEDEDSSVGLENMRFLHYPAIPKENAKPGMVRCGEHSDYGFLTMLFQDDVGGLEVKTVDGEWVEAKPIPGSILINTGNLVEYWTSGIYPATKHRIRIPDTDDERRLKGRYSIAAFNGPDCDALVTPVEVEKRSEEKERLAKSGVVYEKEPISAYDYISTLVAKQYS